MFSSDRTAELRLPGFKEYLPEDWFDRPRHPHETEVCRVRAINGILAIGIEKLLACHQP